MGKNVAPAPDAILFAKFQRSSLCIHFYSTHRVPQGFPEGRRRRRRRAGQSSSGQTTTKGNQPSEILQSASVAAKIEAFPLKLNFGMCARKCEVAAAAASTAGTCAIVWTVVTFLPAAASRRGAERLKESLALCLFREGRALLASLIAESSCNCA